MLLKAVLNRKIYNKIKRSYFEALDVGHDLSVQNNYVWLF